MRVCYPTGLRSMRLIALGAPFGRVLWPRALVVCVASFAPVRPFAPALRSFVSLVDFGRRGAVSCDVACLATLVARPALDLAAVLARTFARVCVCSGAPRQLRAKCPRLPHLKHSTSAPAPRPAEPAAEGAPEELARTAADDPTGYAKCKSHRKEEVMVSADEATLRAARELRRSDHEFGMPKAPLTTRAALRAAGNEQGDWVRHAQLREEFEVLLLEKRNTIC